MVKGLLVSVMIRAYHPIQFDLIALAARAGRLFNIVNTLAESPKVRRIGTIAIVLVFGLGFTQLRSAPLPVDGANSSISSLDSSSDHSLILPMRPMLPPDDSSDASSALISIEATAHHDHTEPAKQLIKMEVTAYCPCKKCCGKDAQGITASGKRVSYNNGHFVAADTSVLPFGTKLVIPGYANNAPVEVTDRGGSIKGNKLDVYFDDHQTALEWGRRVIDVEVVDD